ncbi:MAG: hypothetical protein IPF99_16225 [Deltaproteobacteria bacterium]|nr:hypothetical protein [Deltaproteobacteria bacterium]
MALAWWRVRASSSARSAATMSGTMVAGSTRGLTRHSLDARREATSTCHAARWMASSASRLRISTSVMWETSERV